MKKLLIPAMGVAAAFGAAQPAAADVQLAQLMIQGQPGYTGNVNRTAPTGSPGIAPMNTPVGPSPYSVAPSPSFTQPSPFIGQRGDLNLPEREAATPGEPDASGKIGPTVDRQRARFAGERGADGKLLPTYSSEQAQATTPPQATPPTPAPSDMPRQPSTTRRPGSGAADTPAPQGQNQMGTMGNSPQPTTRSGTTAQSDTSMQHRQQRAHTQPRGDKSMKSSQMRGTSQQEASETAALNALSAEGYTNVGKIERVGNAWQTTAMKDGRQVTVQVDPQTNRVMAR
jgi:hypothetical protein